MTERISGDRQRGHLIVGLLVAVALMGIFSAVAAQAWRDVLRRDLEAEMIFRAQEIVRGLKRYRQDRGALPTELKQLMEPGSRGQYFLRRLYKDPLVKDGKWGLLYLAPQGGLLDPNAPGATEAEPIGSASSAPTTGLPGVPILGSSQREIAGLPIAGVKSLSKDKPFRVYRGQSEYSQWLFSIFDLEVAQPPIPGQPPSGPPRRGPGGLPRGPSPGGTPGR
jgi:type II secretory pathway pseudopilin PulG